jgi:hypothetical protein
MYPQMLAYVSDLADVRKSAAEKADARVDFI